MSDKEIKFDNKTVYILDSYGLIFRCYFAFINRPLTNSKGENVSALFGFFRNLHYIFQHYKPGYLIAAMDSKTKTFRHEMYDQYKATRNKTPEDLHAQIPLICDVLKELGIPVLQCDGYEADDIIATVARKCEETGRTCRILSGDKDLMQLVSESTQIFKPESGASTWKVTGIEGVQAEWGVPPAQLLDLLSLYGDTADNVPGVNGIGVKTASKLLNDYQNLEGIYANIDNIKGATQKRLIEGKENAFFSQKLIRLCDTVPCQEIEDAITSDEYKYNFQGAAQLLKSFELTAVAKNYDELALTGGNETAFVPNDTETASLPKKDFALAAAADLPLPEQNNTDSYRAITKLSELEQYVSEYLQFAQTSNIENCPLAYDSETDSLDTFNCKIVGFSLCYEKGKAVYIPIQQEGGDLFSDTDYISQADAFTQLQKIFSNPKAHIVMHNAKFDLKVLSNLCTDFFPTDYFNKNIKCKLSDTMVMAWLVNPERLGKNGYSLEYLAETQLALKGIEYDQIVAKGQTFADLPLETAYPYAAEDADFTLQLYTHFSSKINSELFNLEMQILPVLTQMELNGIHLDSEIMNQYSAELAQGIIQAEQGIYKEVGHEFNIASPKQLQTVLFEERQLKPGKKTKTGYSTDTSVLEELAYFDSVPRMILEYREMTKLQSTYVETLPKLTDKNGRIHTDFVQTGTATGRLSCREPNLQNIPIKTDAGRRIRSAFTAPEGKVLISADYAQIELVVLAHLSGDPNMCKAFSEGIDVHKSTASLIYDIPIELVEPEMRRTAKVINFGVIYGMSAFRLAQDLEISRTQASSFIESYFNRYSKIKQFINDTVAFAEQNGYIQTILNRRRPILNINSRNKIEKSAAERIAVNSPVQGSAADIVKKAMLDVTTALRENNSPARLLLQVHDELIFECPDNQEIINSTIELIRNKMENAIKLNVPLRVSVEYGKNWGEFH